MIRLNIKKYLKAKRITQKEVAEKLGITQSFLSKKIANNKLTVEMLVQIADILDIHYTELIEEDIVQ